MGMGDKPERFRPHYGTSFCVVLKQYFDNMLMRYCPHEGVQEKYGRGCKVSVYVCRKCRYGVRHPQFAGWKCVYGIDYETKQGG